MAASYAYYYSYSVKKPLRPSRFPFDVAMREICLMKARSLPTWRPFIGPFADAMTAWGVWAGAKA